MQRLNRTEIEHTAKLFIIVMLIITETQPIVLYQISIIYHYDRSYNINNI